MPAVAHWLIPLGYLAFVVPRVAAWLDGREDAAADEERPLEEIVEAVVLRMDGAGEVLDARRRRARFSGLRRSCFCRPACSTGMHVADRVAYLCALADLRETEGFRRVEVRSGFPDRRAPWPPISAFRHRDDAAGGRRQGDHGAAARQ